MFQLVEGSVFQRQESSVFRNSATFREFAWRFANIIARALGELGNRPGYIQIQQHVINIDALFIDYSSDYFTHHDPSAWDAIEGNLTEKNTPLNMRAHLPHVTVIDQYLSRTRVSDPVMDGLRSAVRYDKTYFDRSLPPPFPCWRS